jgi:hypothetical protein
MTFDSYNPEVISRTVKVVVCSVLAATAVGISALAWNAYYNPKPSPQYNSTNTTSVVTNSGLEKVVE